MTESQYCCLHLLQPYSYQAENLKVELLNSGSAIAANLCPSLTRSTCLKFTKHKVG